MLKGLFWESTSSLNFRVSKPSSSVSFPNPFLLCLFNRLPHFLSFLATFLCCLASIFNKYSWFSLVFHFYSSCLAITQSLWSFTIGYLSRRWWRSLPNGSGSSFWTRIHALGLPNSGDFLCFLCLLFYNFWFV